MLENNLSAWVLAAAALGTAASGIVEGLKAFPWLAEAGFVALARFLAPFSEQLDVAYGPDSMRLLRAQYRGETSELTRVIRQGVRIGLTPDNAATAGRALQFANVDGLQRAAVEVVQGGDLSNESRNALGRFELAVDARVDAGLTLAHDHYVRTVKLAATGVALLIAVVTARLLGVRLLHGIIVGVAAVPLAPVAKDVVTAIRSAAEALRARV